MLAPLMLTSRLAEKILARTLARIGIGRAVSLQILWFSRGTPLLAGGIHLDYSK